MLLCCCCSCCQNALNNYKKNIFFVSDAINLLFNHPNLNRSEIHRIKQFFEIGSGEYRCVCNRLYKNWASFRSHTKWECGKAPSFKCPFCHFKSKLKSNLNKHVRRQHN